MKIRPAASSPKLKAARSASSDSPSGDTEESTAATLTRSSPSPTAHTVIGISPPSRLPPGEGIAVTIANVRLALRALGSTRLRTTLTLLGVLIGTAAVILLVGVVTGSKSLLQHRMD